MAATISLRSGIAIVGSFSGTRRQERVDGEHVDGLGRTIFTSLAGQPYLPWLCCGPGSAARCVVEHRPQREQAARSTIRSALANRVPPPIGSTREPWRGGTSPAPPARAGARARRAAAVRE